MKKLFLIASCLICFTSACAQTRSPYYYQRVSLFEVLPVNKQDVLFVGNSITDGGEWHELFQNSKYKNRGISGDTTDGVYDRLSSITAGKPAKIFLLIGINDVSQGKSAEEIANGIARILEQIQKDTHKTKVFLQSVLPVTPHYHLFPDHTLRWKMVADINERLQKIAQEKQITYIDLYHHFADENGQMKKEYTNDGLHLLGSGYLLWKKVLEPYL